FFALRAAARAMAAGDGGTIVNVTSTFAHVGSPGYAAYHAAKGGLSSLTRAAAIGLKDKNIRVNAVAPGTTDTPGLRRGVAATHSDPDAAMAGYLALQPAGRFGTAEEIASGILFLASDQARFVNGAELVIDGGYIAV
ncbi:MAG: SDR family oxidoreductase, partial [Pseudomonadota bacterium]